jgi:cysteine sulfinate desulfinase/cysteine desulfurase-like protein
MPRIYLDANATTPLVLEVLEAMRPFFGGQFGNASSIHQEGQQARSAIEQARGRVAAFLGCRASEIVFTSGGTESDNLAVFGSAKSGDHVISSSVEHHAVLHAVERLVDRGVEATFVPVDGEGVVSVEDVLRALRPMEGLRGGAVEQMRELRDRLETGLREFAAGVNGGRSARVPNTSNVWFDSLDGEALVIGLDLKGLAVSSGAACSSGASEPSHVLQAMGLPIERARASLRFSLHRQTTDDEIDRAIDLVATQVVRLRELSAVPQ